MPLEPGQTLLHYRIVDKLGEGGMGAVYRAEDTRLGREVAIKVLPDELAADATRRRRFEQEARAVAALKHPNIVTVHSVEETETPTGSVSFITMELIEGRPLSELIPKGGLDLPRLFELAIPAAEALSSAHAKRITHRDLKPSNMMLDADGRLKVLDFGLAKLLAPDESSDVNGTDAETATRVATSGPSTEEGKIVGTAAYMSPEQAEGKPVDARTDIFSLGVVLYEMATGRRPFRGDTSISTISSILKDTPPRVSELKPGLPRHLGRIIERCLEKDPGKRFQTARDIANELRGLKREVDSGELPATTNPPRNRKPLLAGLVVGAVLIVAAASVLWPRLQSTPSGETAAGQDDKSIAVLPFVNMSDNQENEYFSDGLAEELLNRLSRVPDLRVAARTSSFHFKGHTGDVSEVAQQLNVATIMEGSVRRAGNQIRVTAQLINASDGFPLWSESYDGQLDDVFAIQEQIATQVVEALKITLLGDDADRLSSRPTDSVEAYEAYLLGHQKMRNRRFDEIEQAVEYFQRAIDLDSEFALAYVGQVEAVSLLATYYTSRSMPERTGPLLERAESLLDRAMELDDRLGEAYAARGFLRINRTIVGLPDGDFDFDGLVADFERAIELSPNYAMAYRWYGRVMSDVDPQRALSLYRQAAELDPLSSMVHANIAQLLQTAGKYDEALNSYRRAVEVDPRFANGYGLIAELYETRGRLDEAVRWYHEMHQRDSSNPEPLFQLATFYLVLGDEASGRLWLTRLRETEGASLFVDLAQGLIHVQRGELAKAEAVLRGHVQVPFLGPPLIFDFDLEAGNYDAILEREAPFESGQLENPPAVNRYNVDGAVRVGAALAGRGDHPRAERVLGKCEEVLLGLDEATRRARFPDLLASVYLFQGRNDEALTEWRIAFEDGWYGSPTGASQSLWFIEAPFAKLDPVRDDPRFRALLDDMRAELDRQRRALDRDGLAIAAQGAVSERNRVEARPQR